MSKLLWSMLLISPIMLISQGIITKSAIAGEMSDNFDNTNDVLEQINNYGNEGQGTSQDQVTNVFQLRDVSPGDWAFEALRNLVERYGCIAGYPDSSFRGNRAMTRYEFAAGMNACLQQIERLIVGGGGGVTPEELATLKRLVQEFEAELAALGTRVDNLEGRVAFLEDHQFSTTTKLQGEVVFGLSDVFGGDDLDIDSDNNTVFQDRVRLDFVTSFTGKDALHTRLDAGNAQYFNNLDQGQFTYNFDSGNDVGIGWLAYYFPIGEKIQVYLPAAYPLWQDFVPTVSPYLEGFTGATAAISSYAESSPIYKIGLAAGGGIGMNFNLTDTLMVSGGYFGGDSFDPSDKNGLFNGEYSALGQITWTPNDKFQFALTYVNAYFNEFDAGNVIFDTGVGTSTARQPFGDLLGTSAITNSYGVAGSFQFSPKLAVNAYGGLTTATRTSGGGGDEEIWYYALGLAFPDLGKEGNLGGIVAGSEPYVGGEDDVAIHVEAFYKYKLNDYISITPGLIWLTSPQGDIDNDDVFVGTLRTTFTF